jgi:hypothetical protein
MPDPVGVQGRHAGGEDRCASKAGTQGKQEVTSEQVGMYGRLVGRTGSAGKVDKADALVGHTNWEVRQAEKLGRTHKKATGGKERHGLCS